MNNNISQTDGSSIQSSYEILEAKLYTNHTNQVPINIYPIIQKILIKESLYSAGIGVEIRIIDGINLLDNLKLMGNEKIFLKVVQRGIDESIEKKFELNLYVSNITDFARSKPGSDAYSLICVSKHVYLNQFTILDKQFSGTVGNNIANICSQQLKIPAKLRDITDSFGDIQGIYPSLKPIEAIVFQLRAANQLVYFYENLKGIVHLKGHSELVSKDIVSTYTTSPFYRKDIGTTESRDEQQEKVLRFSSNLNVSKLEASSNGVYSSETFAVDISNKTVTTTPHGAHGGALLNPGESVSNNNIEFDFKNQPEARTYSVSVNSKAFDAKENYHHSYNSIHNIEGHRHDLDTIRARIVVYGDIDISVGNIIQLNVPPTGQAELDTDKDQYFTGKYIITDIVHNFDSEYTMEMVIKKDSFPVNTDAKRIAIEGEETPSKGVGV